MSTHKPLNTLPEGPIEPVPPPWNLKGTVYIIPFWLSKSAVKSMPTSLLYSPLEGSSPFADPTQSGEPQGGLSMIQILRYTESPVGPYDELIISPGLYNWVDEKDGKRRMLKNARITRIYVSQKFTCWNGRTNWNIPKHLARFTFVDNPDRSTTVSVYPYDMHPSAPSPKLVAEDETPSSEPFFTATIKTIPYVPSFPMSLSMVKLIGMEPRIVQPPLPEGRGSEGELPGTDQWCRSSFMEKAWNTALVWADLKQGEVVQEETEGGEQAKTEDGRYENFLPGLRRWHLGMVMRNATIEFPQGEHWERPGPA